MAGCGTFAIQLTKESIEIYGNIFLVKTDLGCDDLTGGRCSHYNSQSAAEYPGVMDNNSGSD